MHVLQLGNAHEHEIEPAGKGLTGGLLAQTNIRSKHSVYMRMSYFNRVHELCIISMCICRAGFNLLFYGLGSKKALINEFAGQLEGGGVMVVNGHVNTISAKKIVLGIAKAMSGSSSGSTKYGKYLVSNFKNLYHHIWPLHKLHRFLSPSECLSQYML